MPVWWIQRSSYVDPHCIVSLLRGEAEGRRHEVGRRGAKGTGNVLRLRGEAVQADPIKPMLKAPGTKRLKLQHDEPLSSFAFKSNVRCYSEEEGEAKEGGEGEAGGGGEGAREGATEGGVQGQGRGQGRGQRRRRKRAGNRGGTEGSSIEMGESVGLVVRPGAGRPDITVIHPRSQWMRGQVQRSVGRSGAADYLVGGC